MDDNLIERRREAFEKRILDESLTTGTLLKRPDGSYCDLFVKMRWAEWNAALDSAVVELPKQSAVDDLMFISDARSRIERAGLRVKS